MSVPRGASRQAIPSPRRSPDAGHQVRPLQVAVEQKLLDLLGAVNEANQTRPMIGERRLNGRAAVLDDELPPRGLGERRID